MLEFTSNCHSMEVVERWCKDLVKTGAAISVKDTRNKEFDTARYIRNEKMKPKLEQRKFDVVVYRYYIIKIKTTPLYMALPWEADVRIWYDRRIDRAGVKLTMESLLAIVNSLTVISLLRKLDIKLGGDGQMQLDKLADTLNNIITKVEPGSQAKFIAGITK